MLRFIGEGIREIGRKMNRLGLRRRIGTLDRQRGEALARLGKTAWQAKVDLTGFAGLRDQIERLDTRAGDLAAAAKRLEADGAELQARRQAEESEFDALLRPALARQAEAEAALRAARAALADRQRSVREAERQALQEQVSAAKAAMEQLAADVARLTADSHRCSEEVTRIQGDRRAALLPIDTELKRVQDESNRAKGETASVVREQDDRFASLGAALYDHQVADPALAESTQTVAALDQERAGAQAKLDTSLALTRAMPRGTMATFWTVFVVIPLLLIAGAYGLVSSLRPSAYRYPVAFTTVVPGDAGSVPAISDESHRDDAVRAFLRSPDDQASRKQAIEILAADLAELGSTADRSHLPNLVTILKGGEPELRAAAAHAIGMIGPTSAEVPLLVDALNDPRPAVREAAVGALGQVRDDPAIGLLVRRVHTSTASTARPGSGFESVAAPDAGRLRAPVYPGATFLHYASDLGIGRAAFTTPDLLQKVLDFYASAAGQQPLSGEAFSRAYFGASPADPTGAKRLGAEIVEWFKQAAQANRPMAEIEAETNRRSARMANLPLVRYIDTDLYGTPRFVALEETSSNGEKRAARFVAIFEDRALGRAGFEIHVVSGIK